MKLQRLIAILTVLLQRERISAVALAEKFDVSVRTVYRDMQALEQAGVPIVTHAGPGGGFAIVEQYKIDKKLFTHQDIATLLISLNSISGPVSNARVNRTREKIKGLIPGEYGKSIERTSKQLYIDMTPWAANPLAVEAMDHIQLALEQSRLVRFDYMGRHAVSAGRTVEPHQLALKENSWYLRGWCQLRREFRTFKITRIRNLQVLSESFAPRAFDSGFDDFKDWKNDRATYVEIVVEPSLRERVMDFCREEYLTEREDGKIDVRMPFVESDIGYGVLLGMGHRCEVMGPPPIREEFIRRVGLLSGVYR